MTSLSAPRNAEKTEWHRWTRRFAIALFVAIGIGVIGFLGALALYDDDHADRNKPWVTIAWLTLYVGLGLTALLFIATLASAFMTLLTGRPSSRR